jgi:hypothetical protein
MSSLFPPPPPDDGPRTYTGAFDQGKYWIDAQGNYLPISGMGYDHVNNCLAMLLREARAHAAHYHSSAWSFACYSNAPIEVLDSLEWSEYRARLNPAGWMKSTTLYRSLKKRRKQIMKGTSA